MALLLELVATIIMLVAKPFSLVKLSCIFGLRSICIVIQTWIELLRAAIWFHVNIFWRLIVWTIALISLPLRILAALQRERLLQLHLHQIQAELENLVWDRKELEERLQLAIKECKMLELILTELEEEHDQAFAKIELLEGELQDLKDKNHRLKEVKGKALSSFRGEDDTGSKDGSPIHPVMTSTVSKSLDIKEVLDERREVAFSRSLFSAILSLLVGMILWEAEDPCMPLVVALYVVVGMSLRSVVEFFSAFKNKPASDAVALLSLNWFMLGTLTYPTLTRVAQMFAPLALSFLEQIVRWLGFFS